MNPKRSLTIRERDRERAQARAGGKTKQPKGDGLTPEQRRERDAKALQEKAAKKAAQSVGGNNAGGGGRERNLKVRATPGGGSRWLGGGVGTLGFVEGSVREELVSHCDREREKGFLERDGLYEKKVRVKTPNTFLAKLRALKTNSQFNGEFTDYQNLKLHQKKPRIFHNILIPIPNPNSSLHFHCQRPRAPIRGPIFLDLYVKALSSNSQTTSSSSSSVTMSMSFDWFDRGDHKSQAYESKQNYQDDRKD
ncbi:hypothetical protein SO802_022503 [Lithocarpus litseifolius]|uniref:Small EDRK-rich factor-like N-terminal domain-containing protein n=1 Tax=Lithocarpus litseifolius TaxID=425828 RepID=A0AAW2C6V5_9ROSI